MNTSSTNLVGPYDNVSASEALTLYKGMLFSRMIENKMLSLLRQGKVSKWFSGIGQEAISVGVTEALKPDEFIFPLHRNLGVFTNRGIPFDRLLAQWQGKLSGFTKGRDRSFHFGSMEHHIVGMISHLGPQLALADGVALAHLLDQQPKVAVAFTGEGGTSEGDFHEALNLASVWQLPVIFVIENNGYALSTPTKEQYRAKYLASRGKGYGMKSIVLDGNNVLDVFSFMKEWSERIRQNPEPILVECKTFRIRGHEEASGTKYVPAKLLQEWESRDPIAKLERTLLDLGHVSAKDINGWRRDYSAEIQKSVDTVFGEPEIVSDPETELGDVYRGLSSAIIEEEKRSDRTIRFIDAITEGLDQAMAQDPNLVLMGQDIADYGGVFKVTEGLLEKYGAERVRNTPLCESAIIGAAMGLSLAGHPAMVEMQFADFVTCGFNQIVNNLAKTHYRWGQNVNVTIRMPTGGNVGAGPYHSQNPEAWFFHVPGIKIVYPSNAYDAKGLLLASLKDPNPVLFFEHKYLYRSDSALVPVDYFQIPIGKGRVVREGTDCTILTYGLGVLWAEESIDEINADAEIIDLRSLQPLDLDLISSSIMKTGRVLILHEANLMGGVGAELAALISQEYFEYLDAPIVRCAGLDIPVPFAAQLEEIFQAKTRLRGQLEYLLKY